MKCDHCGKELILGRHYVLHIPCGPLFVCKDCYEELSRSTFETTSSAECEIAELKDEIKDLEKQIEKLEGLLKDKDGEIKELKEELQYRENEVERLQYELVFERDCRRAEEDNNINSRYC